MNMDLDLIDAETLKKYTSRRKQDLIRFRECLENKDFSTIETIGHNLKGNGISFGFPELSLLGEKIENSAREYNTAQIRELVDRFEEWLSVQNQSPSSSQIQAQAQYPN